MQLASRCDVTIVNITRDDLLCVSTTRKKNKHVANTNLLPVLPTLIVPLSSQSLSFPASVKRLFVYSPLFGKGEDGHGVSIKLSRWLGKSSKAIAVPPSCPWRIHVYQVSLHQWRVLFITKRDLSMFLSNLPDDIPLSSLVLPGTHDTMAFYGWPVSQCQSTLTPLMAQLHSGIRVLDVRLAIVHNRLISYHGAYPQREPFQIILATLFAFLSDPATCMETIVVSIKQEDFKKHHPHRFSLLVRDEIENGPGGLGMWFLENRIPVLGEVRGKAIMFSRFGDGCGWQGGLQGLGIHPPRWPDSCKAGFIWQCRDTLVRTHDWYNISSFLSIPEKVRLATQNILFQQQPRSPETPATPPILSITYFSAASFPFALPTVVACGFGWPRWGLGIEGVNSRVGKWLLGQLSIGGAASGAKTDHSENQSEELKAPDDHPDIRGWMFLDFYSQPEDGILVPLLIECNFV